MEARCIQHEMDHLEGRLCIDYEKVSIVGTNISPNNGRTDFRVKSFVKTGCPTQNLKYRPGVKKILKMAQMAKLNNVPMHSGILGIFFSVIKKTGGTGGTLTFLSYYRWYY